MPKFVGELNVFDGSIRLSKYTEIVDTSTFLSVDPSGNIKTAEITIPQALDPIAAALIFG